MFLFFKPRADDCTTKQLILLKDMFSLKLCSVQFNSVTQLCPILCDPMDCSMPGLPVLPYLLKLMPTDAIQPSHPPSPPSPPAFILSQHQGLFQ